jgi:phosphoglucosamine mutase
VLVNVRVVHKADALAALEPLVSEVEASLDGSGRVLVRASGTEPLIRVMVEAPSDDEARRVAESLAEAIRPA